MDSNELIEKLNTLQRYSPSGWQDGTMQISDDGYWLHVGDIAAVLGLTCGHTSQFEEIPAQEPPDAR